jgi:TolA-binding protein
MSGIRLKRFSDATTSLRDLLKKSASSKFAADAHYWLGVMLDEDRKTQEAETELRTAAKDGVGKDWQKDAEFRLAVVLQKNSKEDESASLFQSLLTSQERDNFSPQLLEWLAEFKFGKKQYQESVDAAKLMAERTKDTNWLQIGWCLTGRGQLALGDKAAAEQAYRKAMALNVNTHLAPESALRLGELLLEGTNRTDAAAFFSKAATLASGEQLLGVRARAYIGLGKTAKASSDFEAASRYFMIVGVLFDDPEVVPECLFEAAEAYKKLNRQDDAAKTIKDLKARYPQSEWARKTE